MPKKIIINQNSLLKLKEMVDNENLVNHKTCCPIIDEAAPEVDEYEIGGEEKNGDVVMGGNYFHVKESLFNKLLSNVTSTILKYRPNKFSRWAVISLANLSLIPKYFEKRTYALEYKKWLSRDRRLLPIAIVDLDKRKNYISEGYRVSVTSDLELINTIEFIPHENAREEGYEDNEIDDFEPYYEIEAFDNNGESILYGDLTVDELFDYFPQSIINDIIDRDESNRVTLSNPNNNTYRIEDILYRDTTPSNIDDVDEVNRIAKKIQTGGPSAYLLVDGEFISFQDHISITNVDGVTPDKFLALGNIRIKNGGIELIKKPTREQLSSIKQWVRSQDEVVIDFAEESHGTYPRHLFSATYKSPNPNRIVNDIIYYFEDGVRPQGNMFEEKVNENIDFEVDSSEIDLSSFKKQDELVPNIWEDNGNTLNSRVRLKLLDIADDFWKFVNLSWVEPKHIVLCGSICNFNWSSYSDIDLHIVVDLNDVDDKTDFVREYLDSKKNEWNEEHEHLKIMGYAVEIYVQDVNDETESNGIYDLEENVWIKKPNSNNIKSIGLNKFSIKDKTADLMTIIDGMEDAINSTDDTHVAEEIGKDAEYLWDKIKTMRKDSLDSEGESGSGNISYKYMRRMGYLDKLWDIRYLCYDKTNSLNEGVQYENFRTNQVLRYKIIGTMVEDGYVFHGANEEFDSFDENKIRGGSRGAYGYGAYFTNAAYKCEEYGDRFMIANINDFSFIDLEDTVNPYNNPFTNGLKEYNWLKGRLDDVRTAMEYDEISNKIDAFNSNPNKDLIERAESVISSYDGRLTYRTLNSKIPMGYEDYSKRISEMYLSLGYDGFICGNQFVIFNFNKLNANMVKDKEALIEEYYNKILNTVKESKEIVKEYLEKDYNAPLYHYFKWASEASAEDKARDLAYECSHYLYKYIKQVHYRYQEFDELLDENGEFDADDEEKIEKFIEYLVKERLCDHFISVMGDIVNGSGMHNDLPTWMHTDFLRVVKNEWCIHFGNDAMNIALEGFTGGTEDISHLSYTDAGRQKHQAGYNFAFLIDDRNVDRNEYGNEAVIFRTSGVLIYHYGDNEDQVIFYGPNAHDFIPIRLSEYGEWVVEGKKGQVLKSGDPSEIAAWATDNLQQYRKQIITGKSGYIPMKYHWDSNLKKNIREPYPFYRESIKKYSNTIKLLKEEFSVDGNSEHNPYKKRWDAERKALKDFVCNYGKVMQSLEDDKGGKLYKCFWDKTLSQLIGYNYCLCVQWDELQMKPKSIVYIRACDRFTPNIRRNIQFDTRGRDNLRATSDDYGMTNNQQT